MGIRGMGSILILFALIMVLFGTKRLREIGEDLGVAIKSFRKGLEQTDDEKKQ